jgi:hypothetical protein
MGMGIISRGACTANRCRCTEYRDAGMPDGSRVAPFGRCANVYCMHSSEEREPGLSGQWIGHLFGGR